MARQNINVNPTVREFEAYMDFSGGINTETSNERLADNEFTEMLNVDLGNRGTVKKRTGYSYVSSFTPEESNTMVQGFFFFRRKNEINPEIVLEPDIIFVKNGFFYVKEYNSNTITNLPFSQIQTTRIVEAVQYYDELYVATGDKNFGLVKIKYNSGWSVSVVSPYEPNSQELYFIGMNVLFGEAMQNTNSSGLELDEFQAKGLTFRQNSTNLFLRSGIKDESIKINAYFLHNTSLSGYNPADNIYYFYYRKRDIDEKETHEQYPSSNIVAGTSISVVNPGSTYSVGTNTLEVYHKGVLLQLGHDYQEVDHTSIKLEKTINAGEAIVSKYKPSWYISSSKYGTISDNAYTSNGNTFYHPYVSFTPLETGLYDFRVIIQFKQNSDYERKRFTFNSFEIKSAFEKGDIEGEKLGGIKSCNRIRLHFERLMLFGDVDEPTQMYFSHLEKPNYFPAINTFVFDTGKKEPITTVERIQNYLTVFTKTTIHTITGVNPSEYTINLINDSIGCIAPRSAVLTANTITFLSQEGVFTLRPSSFRLDQLNVQRVDTKIKSQIPKDTNACAVNYDSQYIISFPNQEVIYRYYYEQGSWVKDSSPTLDFSQFLTYTDKLYATRKYGNLLIKDDSVYTDGNIGYDMFVETKYFDLSKSFNFKKLRKLYVLAKSYDLQDSEYKIKIYADTAIVLDPEVGYAEINPDTDYVYWHIDSPVKPNIEFHQATIFGDWVLGEDILGGNYLDVQKARIRGKCRRVKIQFVNSQPSECELFGFGLEFKLKKP